MRRLNKDPWILICQQRLWHSSCSGTTVQDLVTFLKAPIDVLNQCSYIYVVKWVCNERPFQCLLSSTLLTFKATQISTKILSFN